ncbi:MAG: ABC transporter ATP-binding protein [Candidatus Bathyarchaeia archaeon]
MTALLTLKDVYKSFGGLRAVDGVSLEVEGGSITGLIGPNGSGKTTMFNTISGVYKPDSGEIYFDGKRIDELPPYEIYERGLVRSFQIPRLFKKMTVLDNMMLASRDQIGDSLFNVFSRRAKWKSQESEFLEKALDILRFLGLHHLRNSLPTEISGGQIKLLEIGRALMANPKMLLLDEPAAGVNPVLAKMIFDKIVELRDRENLTFFIIEHRIELLLDLVDQVFVMNKGSILASGPPEAIAKDKRVIEAYLGA